MSRGIPERISPQSQKYYAFAPSPEASRDERCFLISLGKSDVSGFDTSACVRISEETPDVMILEDRRCRAIRSGVAR